MAAEDIGKINSQIFRSLMDDLMARIDAMSYDEMGEFTRIMAEGAGRMVEERDRAIRELAPEIFWIEGLEVGYDYDKPERKIYVLNLLDQLVAQQRRIRLLERRVDDLTEKNIELSWRRDPTDDQTK
jgi:hypothetical protein